MIALLIVGIPIAYWTAFSTRRWKFLVESVVALPLVLPPTVLGFYMLIGMGPRSPIGRAWQAAVGRGLPFTFEGLLVASIVYSPPRTPRFSSSSSRSRFSRRRTRCSAPSGQHGRRADRRPRQALPKRRGRVGALRRGDARRRDCRPLRTFWRGQNHCGAQHRRPRAAGPWTNRVCGGNVVRRNARLGAAAATCRGIRRPA